MPEAVVHHHGGATFEREFGAGGCRQLALRNTLLWQWKNLRHPAHHARFAAGIAARLMGELGAWPRRQHAPLLTALCEAWQQWRAGREPQFASRRDLRRERQFFERFSPRQIDRGCLPSWVSTPHAAPQRGAAEAAHA